MDEIWKEDDSRADDWKNPEMRSRDPCVVLKQVIDCLWGLQGTAKLLQERTKFLDDPHGGFMIELLDQHLARREFERSSDAEGGQKNGGERPGEP